MRYVMRHVKVGIALLTLLFLLLGTLLLLSVEKQKQTIRQEASITPSISHVFVIVMENHNWSSIKGNSSAPYVNNTLLPMGAHAEQYYNPPGIHPSEPNYLWLEAGSNLGVTDDNDPGSNHQQTAIHLVPMLHNAGFSWKSYQEDISGTSCPLVSSGQYAPKHNPFVFFDDITNNNSSTSQNCISHIRPYTELANDLQNNTVANYNFITPNLCNDMHDCNIATGDTWLANNIPTILNSSAYKNGGAIFITWDEGESNGHDSDGPIGMIVLSPFAKAGYQNSIHYTHSSTLRTIEEIFGLPQFLRDAANATDLGDLFAVPLTGNTATTNPTPTQLVPTITPMPTHSTTTTGKLTWTPPQLNNPVTINMTTTHQDLHLDNKDYILKFPGTPVVGVYGEKDVIFISGGHNIVMIGGEINVPNMPDSMNGTPSPNLADQRQAMRFDGQTGTVFVEGLEVSGTCMDFMDISAPQATVILQNVRVEQCRSHFEALSGGYTDEHPDLIQPWGGTKEIDIDRFTGFTDNQGMQLDSDLGIVGSITIKRTNIGRINQPGLTQYGRYYMWEGCNTSLCGTNPFSPKMPHWDLTDDSFYIQPADNRSLGKSVWPDSGFSSPQTAVVAPDGHSVSWPNYTAKINGRVRLGPPPNGDFVSAGSVGIGYVSPGYTNGTTTNPSQTPITPTSAILPSGSSQTANAMLSFSLQLPGIGPNNNLSPLRKVRVVTLTTTNLDTNAVTTKQVTTQFNGSIFQTPSVLFAGLPVGKYQFRAKVNGYLSTILQNQDGTTTFSINQNITIAFPTMTLIPGDIAPVNGTSYGDDSLDLLDYNMFLGCINSPQKTVFCPNPSIADLDDDGRVDGVDYNLLIRGFAAEQTRSNTQ